MAHLANDASLTARTNEPRYMVQLDALRALAVFGVLVHHFLPPEFF